MKPVRLLVLPLALAAVGCGYTEQEWKLQLDKHARAIADAQAQKDRAKRAADDLKNERTRAERYATVLDLAGIDAAALDKLDPGSAKMAALAAELEERERAINDWRTRQIEMSALQARAELLKKHLAKDDGVIILASRERLAIQIPPERLFAGSSEALRKEGRDLLVKLATAIKAEPALALKTWRVEMTFGGKGGAKSSLPIAAGRAREALNAMLQEKGGLPPARWSANAQALELGAKDVGPTVAKAEIVMLPDPPKP